MVSTHQLIKAILCRRTEGFVRCLNDAVHVELNHSMRTVNGRTDCLLIEGSFFLFCDVRREFDDANNGAFSIDDRIVGRLDPDRLAAFAKALILARVGMTITKAFPERTVFGALRIFGVTEHRMMLAHNVAEAIARGFEECLIGCQNASLQIEFDRGLGAVHCLEDRFTV